jgi:hypothetical protein
MKYLALTSLIILTSITQMGCSGAAPASAQTPTPVPPGVAPTGVQTPTSVSVVTAK